MKFIRGFTLSELLVSLSVLGLVAAMAIPLVLTALEEQAMKAKLKETINTLANSQFLLNSMGEDPKSEELFKDNIGMVHVCDSSDLKCKTIDLPMGVNDPSGIILANGVHIWDMEDNPTGTDALVLDWNGNRQPNELGEDILIVMRCIDETIVGGGACSATMTGNPRTGSVSAYSGSAESVSLWNKIFGL